MRPAWRFSISAERGSGVGNVMPTSAARRSTASLNVSRSVSCRKVIASPFLPDEKSKNCPLSSLTKNDGVRSLVNGDRPANSRPCRRSRTVLPTRSDSRTRDFSSSMKASSKRTADHSAAGR